MRFFLLVIATICLLQKSVSSNPLPNFTTFDGQFPCGFAFGVSTGPYLHEGAYKEDGKAESICDCFYGIDESSSGSVAADSYHNIEVDVALLKELGVKFYRFGLSWARLIPTGTGDINILAVKYYKTLIDRLLEYNIEPVVTIYTSDLPQVLEEQGGFLCEDFPCWYADYARKIFEIFGPYVKIWITFSSPQLICNWGYGDGIYPPGIKDDPGVNDYICGHNLLKAHAKAYHIYDTDFRPDQKGQIAISIRGAWFEPVTNNTADRDAANAKLQFYIGWFMHPIYNGNYPERMINIVKENSNTECMTKSRLPIFTEEEIEFIKDTHDFFGLEYFGSYKIKEVVTTESLPVSYDNELSVECYQDNTDNGYGIRQLLKWIKTQYGDTTIFITNSGLRNVSDDYQQTTYISGILANILAAIIEDHANIGAYTHYSLLDGFEFEFAYSIQCGLYAVDFSSPDRKRTARKSAEYYQHICKYSNKQNVDVLPQIEFPKFEHPKIEHYKIEHPKVEYPKYEHPKVEHPKVEHSKVEQPKVEHHKFKPTGLLHHLLGL